MISRARSRPGEPGQSLSPAAPGQQPAAYLGLAEHGLLPARVAQIAGQGELVAAAAGAAADGRDRDVGGLRQPQHHVGPDRQCVVALWRGEVCGCREIEVVEEEAGHTALEDDDLDAGVVAEFHDELVQPRHGFADDQVHGRVRERDRGDLGCRALEADRAGLVHGALHPVAFVVALSTVRYPRRHVGRGPRSRSREAPGLRFYNITIIL